MRKRAPFIALASTLICMISGTAASAQFGDLNGVIKVVGIAGAVKIFGTQINSFLNKILQEHNVGGLPYTKVVPIVRVGAGTYVGAAQLVGSPEIVRHVGACAEGELDLGLAHVNNRVQLRFLLPISSVNLLKTLPSRVKGVGVSAILDFHV